jgi:transcriptional regulator with XRE-family HTH domain
MKQIAVRLKELRAERNLTQANVFEDTGLNIGRIEQGKSDLNVSNLHRLCQYFELTLEEFVRGMK